MRVGGDEQVEEERRLLYVAMRRAKPHLHVVQPMRPFRGISTGMAMATS